MTVFLLNWQKLNQSYKKPTQMPVFQCFYWWEWLDSNQLRLKPTDLQSAPALQLRRTPNLSKIISYLGAGSGNRTRISSLEGLHTSLCTMPATNVKRTDYILKFPKSKCKFHTKNFCIGRFFGLNSIARFVIVKIPTRSFMK